MAAIANHVWVILTFTLRHILERFEMERNQPRNACCITKRASEGVRTGCVSEFTLKPPARAYTMHPTHRPIEQTTEGAANLQIRLLNWWPSPGNQAISDARVVDVITQPTLNNEDTALRLWRLKSRLLTSMSQEDIGL